jgi:integrase
MKTDFIDNDVMSHILYALTYENRLVCKVCLETGLRVGDVLLFKSKDLDKGTFTITEQKTKKKKVIRLRASLKKELRSVAGSYFVFEHRTDPMKHRTRQAVYTDLKRACKAFRIKENISPHSMRKSFAVDLFKSTGDLKKVQQALNHDNDLVTMLYAMADVLSKKKRK